MSRGLASLVVASARTSFTRRRFRRRRAILLNDS
jgi:hypothetical protein